MLDERAYDRRDSAHREVRVGAHRAAMGAEWEGG